MSLVRTVIVAFSLAGVSVAGVDEITMFRGGPAHSGVYESTNPTLRDVEWRYRTDGPVLSTPVVAGNAVYVGSTDRFLYALQRDNGALLWKFETQGPVSSSPATAFGLVYAGSTDGKFYAVDAGTGKKRWSFTTGGERRFSAPGIHGIIPRTEMMPDPFDVFLSSPVIADGMVYFGSGDHNVYALDAKTGALRWKFKTGNVVHASPAVVDGVVYIGSWDRNMYALSAATGRERWHFQTGNDTVIYNQVGIASSAAIANGVVYFGCRDGHFYAVDAATGALRWSHDNKMGWVIASPAVQDGVVYFPTSDGTRFKALDARTGAVKYSVENKAVSFSSPAIVNDIVYFGSSDGWVHALNRGTGAVEAEFQTDGSKQNAARYTDAAGRLDFSSLHGNGTLESTFEHQHVMFTLGSILSSPVVVGGRLYVGSADGTVYAIK